MEPLFDGDGALALTMLAYLLRHYSGLRTSTQRLLYAPLLATSFAALASVLDHASTPSPPSKRIRDVLAHELAEDAAVREGWILWSEMQRLAMFNEALRSSVADRSRRWVGGVATMIRVAQNDGSVSSDIDADAAALRLTALVDGLGGHIIVQSRTRAEALAALEQAFVSELGLAGITA